MLHFHRTHHGKTHGNSHGPTAGYLFTFHDKRHSLQRRVVPGPSGEFHPPDAADPFICHFQLEEFRTKRYKNRKDSKSIQHLDLQISAKIPLTICSLSFACAWCPVSMQGITKRLRLPCKRMSTPLVDETLPRNFLAEGRPNATPFPLYYPKSAEFIRISRSFPIQNCERPDMMTWRMVDSYTGYCRCTLDHLGTLTAHSGSAGTFPWFDPALLDLPCFCAADSLPKQLALAKVARQQQQL